VQNIEGILQKANLDGAKSPSTRNDSTSQELMTAVTSGNLSWVDELLSEGVNPDYHDNSYGGNYIIHVAAKCSDTKLLQQLVRHGASLASRNDELETPLHVAISAKQTSMALAIIELGADLTVTSSWGLSALHYATHHNLPAIVQHLLSKGVNPNIRSEDGQTALYYCLRRFDVQFNKDDSTVLKILLDHGADPTIGLYNTSRGPLHLAAHDGCCQELELLAAAAKSLDVWAYYLSPKTSDKVGAYTPLRLAIRTGQPKAVRILLSHGAAPNPESPLGDIPKTSALWQAVRNGNKETVIALLEAGEELNRLENDGHTILSKLAWERQLGKKRVEVVELLLEHGANPSFKNNWDNAPLHEAAISGDNEFADLLLKEEVEVVVDALGNRGKTPFMLAAEHGQLHMLRLLHWRGARWDATDTHHADALALASWKGQITCMVYLLGLGVDINRADPLGWTALHCAAEGQQMEAVRFLLQFGANRKAVVIGNWTERNALAGTAADIAFAKGYTEISDLIEDFGDASDKSYWVTTWKPNEQTNNRLDED
jgi:uncharacterized protein